MVSGSCFFVHAFCLGFVLKASLCVVVVVFEFFFFYYFPFLSRLLATSISHFCVVLLKRAIRGLVVLFKCENINGYSPRRATPLHTSLHDTQTPVSKTLLPCRFLTVAAWQATPWSGGVLSG